MNQEDRIPSADPAPDPASDASGRTVPRPGPVPPTPQDHTRVAPRPLTPANDAAAFGLPPHPPCPFCDATHTELHSPFGPQLSVASYWCNDCRAPFEVLKWRNPPHG